MNYSDFQPLPETSNTTSKSNQKPRREARNFQRDEQNYVSHSGKNRNTKSKSIISTSSLANRFRSNNIGSNIYNINNQPTSNNTNIIDYSNSPSSRRLTLNMSFTGSASHNAYIDFINNPSTPDNEEFCFSDNRNSNYNTNNSHSIMQFPNLERNRHSDILKMDEIIIVRLSWKNG